MTSVESDLHPASVAGSRPLIAALQLTFCPRCDYSLQGLPDHGNCPECGEPYDQQFVVLRTRPVMSGKESNSQSAFLAKRLYWSAGAVVLFVFLILRFDRHGFFWPAFCGSMVSVSNLVLDMIVLATVPRRGEILVWTCASGIGQQAVIDPRAVLPKITKVVGVTYPILLWFWFMRHQPGFNWKDVDYVVVGTLIFLLLVLVVTLMDRRWKDDFAVPPEGIRPGLLPWSAYDRIEWKKVGDNVYELWTRWTGFLGAPKIVHVRAEMTPGQAAAFKANLDQWTAGKI